MRVKLQGNIMIIIILGKNGHGKQGRRGHLQMKSVKKKENYEEKFLTISYLFDRYM